MATAVERTGGRHRQPGSFVPLLAGLPTLLACAVLTSAAVAAPPSRRVGALVLTACAPAGTYCGVLARPLDPLGTTEGTIGVGFEFYPHTASGRGRGTLVATEGGPGYPARASRDDYLALFQPLRRDHDVLIMDNRGTGTSEAVDCPSLQRAQSLFTIEAVAACAESLGPRAWLYSTSYASDDLAALLDALGIARVDLYGDSYGTFTAQTFAVRHPSRLRTLVLDGAYPLDGADPGWYPNYAPGVRERFNRACARAAGCRALPGSSIEHIQPALEQLRAQPVDVETHDADGNLVKLRADAVALATAMFGGAPALATVRELDAAARAYVAGDQVPLVRLLGEARVSVDSRDPSYDPRLFSSGVAAAIMCGDAPQIYDMTLPPAARRLQRDRLIAERERRDPAAYAPFTYEEYRGIPLDYAFIDECVLWPAVSTARAASIAVASEAHYPTIPVLVVSGEMDSMTTVADGREVAQHFANATQLILANSFHVNALPRARGTCGAAVVRRFIRSGHVADDCSGAVPAPRLVARFARSIAEIDPALNRGAPDTADRDLRIAAVAVATVGDVVRLVHDNGSGHGVGLRGGSFQIERGATTTVVRLDSVRWTEDAVLDGRLTLAARGGAVHAEVTVHAPTTDGHLTISWHETTDASWADVAGHLNGRALRARTGAP